MNKQWAPLIEETMIAILISMFLVVLPVEVILQIFWSFGYTETAYWIENFWKMMLFSSVVMFPIARYCYLKLKKPST